MIYLDANVFALANLNTDLSGDNARILLGNVQNGKLAATTSVLSFDELVWAVKKYRTFEDATSAGEALLHMPRLRILPVETNLLTKALMLMRQYRLDPRDSIHAASALQENLEVIVSMDGHFDRIKELKRKDLTSLRWQSALQKTSTIE
jgi:predicted nucleic acid-binding protein